MTDKNFEEYIEKRNQNVNQIEAEKRYEILKNYIFISFDFVKNNKKNAFFEYLYSFILEDMGLKRKNDEHSPEFVRMYDNIKERINLSIDELKKREIVDFDYENEVLAIAFRILKYFYLDDGKLFLKINMDEVSVPKVRVYNDYRSSVFTFVVEKKNMDYVSLKIIEEKIDSLRKEIEYLNDFVLNYYQERFLEIFRITKIVFEKQDITNKFIQGEVKFTASFKIIQKLIGPLYLNRESYGMRELIQNSVDACQKKDQYNGQIDIKYVGGDNPRVVIKDNGIGMNEQIIINNFLTIGESSKKDENSIGKFGIGILAAFLLADKMKFKTCYDAGEYIYESEFIELEAVTNKDKFINININENKENFRGTEIELELKNEIIENDEIRNICDRIKNDIKNLLDNLLGKSNYYGRIWYGYSAQRDKFNKIIFPEENKSKIEFDKISEKDISFYKDIVSKAKEFKLENDLEKNKRIELKESIESCCNELSNNIQKLEHMEAYAVFTFLQANKWFLNRDNSTKIIFYDNEEELESICNIDINIIEDNNVIKDINVKEEKEYKLGKIEELNVSYIWSKEKEYQGNVFCNSMLIPSKYQFETPLGKVFNILPTILIDEGSNSKIEIDLAREKCKLRVGNKNCEEEILRHILLECLQKLESNTKYLKDISWIYFKNKDGKIKKGIKNKFWLSKHIEQEYFLIFLKTDTCISEDCKIQIADQICNTYGCDIIIEFVEDDLHINTFFYQIVNNDLYIAATFGAILFLGKREQEIIKNLDTSHLRALVLAAKNISGDIDVRIANQLKLNPTSLNQFKNDDKYKEQLNIPESDENVYCLNYRDNNREVVVPELPQSVNAIMKVKFENYDCSCNFFDQIANTVSAHKRNCIWNGFQEGISQIQKLECDELIEFLLKEYDCKEASC